jgi:hypothetical protein
MSDKSERVPEQATKHQHFVPQFYLRSFLNENNEVEVLDCERRLIGRPKGTKGICGEDYFYAIRTGEPDEVSQKIEAAFGQAENEMAKRLTPIIEKLRTDAHIENEEKWWVAYLMSMIWIRNPMFRKQVNRIAEQMSRKVFQVMFAGEHIDEMIDRFDRETANNTSPEVRQAMTEMVQKGEYEIEFSNAHHMQMFSELQGFANLFYGQDWVVYITKGSEKFLTSDNPVAVEIPKRKGFYGPTFLERTHYFALAPDMCIVARYPRRDEGKKLKRKTLFAGEGFRVIELNSILASQAYENAFAQDRATLETLLTEIQRREEWLRELRAMRAAIEGLPGMKRRS